MTPGGLRVALAHQTVRGGDAIGNDVIGMYHALAAAGHRPAIVCENFDPPPGPALEARVSANPEEFAGEFDVLVYHHSIYWPHGDALIGARKMPCVVKFHNVTPMEFFRDLSPSYEYACREGRHQTHRLFASGLVTRWQADSTYNSLELRGWGEDVARIDIVPPFTRVDELLAAEPHIEHGGTGELVAAYVGRIAPNKGHAEVLGLAGAWRTLMPELPLRVRLVGGTDPQLAPHREALDKLEGFLGLRGTIEWIEGATDEQVAEVLRSADIYLNFSRHEGFCVPLVEAQSLGLPTISMDVGAVRETAGEGQVVVPVAKSADDYATLAAMARAVATSPLLRGRLVAAGRANVRDRFTRERICAAFLDSLDRALATV